MAYCWVGDSQFKFPKGGGYLDTFRSTVSKTHIDYVLLRKGDKRLCEDSKVIPSENFITQNDLPGPSDGFEDQEREEEEGCAWLTKDQIGQPDYDQCPGDEREVDAYGDLGSSVDAGSMWDRTARCIRQAAREVLGSREVILVGIQGLVVEWRNPSKGWDKVMYAKLVESKDREEERMNRERYKMVRKKTKLSIMEAKTATFECWYVE